VELEFGDTPFFCSGRNTPTPLFSSIYLLYSDYIDVLFAQRRTLFHFVWRDVGVYGGDENLPAKALGERIERGKNISLAMVMPTFR